MTCTACGTENESGRKFCRECGNPLVCSCASCGTANAPDAKFCGECGARLVAGEADAPAPRLAERRLVSVLFADLVGFTSFSEGRDAEETRELLSRYFDAARSVVHRYGGTVEKFIGDAVMAVWGAPVAQEDDCERAVRAALDLLDVVPQLDPALQARAGVLTGEAAVTLGAEGQGMVAGDLVNTASRVQAAAPAGAVLVGETTRRASEAAVAYESAGMHTFKGKSAPVPLWRALRVVAARGGEGRTVGLEPPFAGRERELRLLKDVFHATASEGRAHLVSVIGVAGIGKSRLAWEFEKYLDGLVEEVWWHKGRCLSYGDGVAYWALAEMVRMRARLTDDEPAADAVQKLHGVLLEIVTDPVERDFVEPRLQHLLGLADRVAPDKEDLFSAWRLFVERMSQQHPVAMVFEDLQWADASLIEFLEYLLEWSRSFPIFVLTLARPELQERHPRWGLGARSFMSLSLEPLPADAIDAGLRALAPGLPDTVVASIRERADGVPLYAVETVRMLLDRGMLERTGSEYRVTGPIALDVPETLQSLIAARLDGLEPSERQALQDASVLGRTFQARGLTALTGRSDAELEPVLATLVRKEVLFLESDPRSPERGQYGFLQALVQRVAYDTLSRHDRRDRHLAAARYLADAGGFDPDEIAEVIAAHYLDAHAADPTAADAAAIKREAGEWLCRAGERAASLAAVDDAQRAFEGAAELTDDPVGRAQLLERAGALAAAGKRWEQAEARHEAALALCREAGATHDAARIAAALGEVVWHTGRIDEALELMERAFAVLVEDEPDADLAALVAQLGRIHLFAGHDEEARARLELALQLAEDLDLPKVLAGVLNSKSILRAKHPHEARALVQEALRIALDHDLGFEAMRAYNNLLVHLTSLDQADESRRVRAELLELARRRGDRFWETQALAAECVDRRDAGDWDAALGLGRQLAESPDPGVACADAFLALARVAFERGDMPAALGWLDLVETEDDSSDIQRVQIARAKRALLAIVDGRPRDAVGPLRESVGYLARHEPVWVGVGLADVAELAILLDDPSMATAVAEPARALRRSVRTRLTDLQLARIDALDAAGRGDEDAAAAAFASALAAARTRGDAYWLAPLLTDYGTWLVRAGRAEDGAPLLAEARTLFERMGATRRLERIDAVLPAAARA